MEKDEEIERLKKVIIMQERIRDKMQKQFQGSLERGVDKWLHCTLDEEIDAGMNGRELETIISAREQLANESRETIEEEAEQETPDQKPMSTNDQSQNEQESMEVPLNSMKDMLDEKIDQITSLKMENAKL
jgi:hypothetical protein